MKLILDSSFSELPIGEKSKIEPTLDDMLLVFDPIRHGGEVMADRSTGVEAFPCWQSSN
jgi:hypothetical protein